MLVKIDLVRLIRCYGVSGLPKGKLTRAKGLLVLDLVDRRVDDLRANNRKLLLHLACVMRSL